MRWPDSFSFFRTLKFRIVAMVIATSVLAAWSTAHLVLDVTQADLRQLLLTSEQDNRERTAALLAGKLETLKQAIGRVGRQAAQPALWQDPAALEQLLLGERAIGALFEGIAAIGPEGRMLARVSGGAPSRELIEVGDRDYFRQAMQTDQAVVSAPLRSRPDGNPVVLVAQPVLDAQGRHLGVISASLRLNSNGLFASMGAASEVMSGVDLVIDRAGTILSHPDPARLLGNAADEPGLGEVVAQWRASGSPIDLDASASWSQGYLVSMAGIALSDWMHVRLTPDTAALLPVRDAQRAAWRAAAVVAVLAAALSGAASLRMVRPISRLQRRAEAMLADSDASAEGWPSGHGELGAMGQAFQRLLVQRQQQRQELHALLQQFEITVDLAEVGIALVRDGQVELASQRLCQIFQGRREEIVGQPARLLHATDATREAVVAQSAADFAAQRMFDQEVQMRRLTGEPFWGHLRGRAMEPGRPEAGAIWVLEDVTQHRLKREQLTWAASHDALTGLPNRAAFEAELTTLTETAAHAPFCALFLDLDFFKQVNDSGGHAAGDALLRGVAKVLAGPLRRSDTAARLGGDEFAVLLPHCPLPRAQQIAATLCREVSAYRLQWEDASYSVGCSLGLVFVDGRHADAAAVLAAADAACYKAKRQGRNQVVVAS